MCIASFRLVSFVKIRNIHRFFFSFEPVLWLLFIVFNACSMQPIYPIACDNICDFPLVWFLTFFHPKLVINGINPKDRGIVLTLSVEHSSADRRSLIRGSPGETPPCTLMKPGTHLKSIVGAMPSKFPLKIILQGVPKQGSNRLSGGSKLWRYMCGPFLRMSPRPVIIFAIFSYLDFLF